MLYPLMLAGLVGLSVPIIIHLIHRQRLKPQLLATSQFLDQQDLANAFAPVPRDLLQLLLRLLLLALFVLLMSRLVLQGSSAGPRTMAVVLDQSMSMQQKTGEKGNLFDASKRQVLDLIDGLADEDRLALVLVGDHVTVETGYLQDKSELRRVAEGFEVSDSGGAALLPAVRDAADHLRSRREENACVLVFSDHQRLNYLPATGRDAASAADDPAWAGLAAALSAGGVRVLLIDDTPPADVNLTIEQAHFSPERVPVGASSRLTAVVHNRSDKEQTTRVHIQEGEQVGPDRSVTLEPGEAAHLDLVHRFEAPTDSACRVEIEDDFLPGDNRFQLPMRMKERQQVLLVGAASQRDDEDRGLELSYQGADLLAYALNPGESLGQSGTNINVKRVTPQMLSRVSLPLYSMIVLYGVTELPEQSTKDLSVFVKNGGGIWFIPDGDMSPLRFNNAYGPLLQGFAIGQLKVPDQVQGISRSEAQMSHPLLLPLVREEWGSTREIFVNRYFGVENGGTGKVALRAENGDALMVVVPQDRGQVLVQLFGSELESSTLPRTTAFVPLVQHVSATLGERGEPTSPDTVRVGDVLRMRLPEFRNLNGDVQVSGPESKSFAMTGPEGDEIRVEGLLQAGEYEVAHPGKKSGRKRYMTVNPVRGESDLLALSTDEQEQIFGAGNVARLKYADLASQFSHRYEIAGLLGTLVLLAFIAEALLGAWQSRRGAKRDQAQGAAA